MKPRLVSEVVNDFGESVKSYQVGRRVASVVLIDDKIASVSLFALDLKGRRVPVVQTPDGDLAETFVPIAKLDDYFANLATLPAPPPNPVPIVCTAEELAKMIGAPVFRS